MISYLMKHWRGQHHVAWGLFVNGLLGCIVVMLAWEIVRDSTPLNWSQQVLWVNLAVFWAWFLWAAADTEVSATCATRTEQLAHQSRRSASAYCGVGFAYGFVSDLPDVIKGTPRLGGPIRIGKPGSVPRTRSVAPAGRTQIVVQWLDTAQGSMELREIYKIENALESVSDGEVLCRWARCGQRHSERVPLCRGLQSRCCDRSRRQLLRTRQACPRYEDWPSDI